MKKIFLLCAAWIAGISAFAQLNVDITTGYDPSIPGLITPGQPDDTWQWWDGTNYVPVLTTTGYDSWGLQHFPSVTGGCGEWLSPYVTAAGTTYNGNPANSSQLHEYMMTFSYTAGCPLANARIELNAVGADDYIYFKLNNTIYNVNATLSNCGGPGNCSIQYSITVPLNAADIIPGSDTLRVFVCSDYKWTGFVLCGSLKADYMADPNLVPTITSASIFCAGSPIVVNGSSATTNVTWHYWEMAECDASGFVTPGGYLWSGYYSGAPTGNFSIPNSSTAPCGRYYKIKLALSNPCSFWVETNQVIYLQCPPAPVISGPASLCYGQSGTYSIGTWPRGTSIQWSTGATNVTSINYTPTASTTLSVTVTYSSGCSGSATLPITLYNTNPDFILTSTLYSGYFTCSATPVVTTGLPPGFGYSWSAEEVTGPPTYASVPNTLVNNPAIGCWWTMTCNFTGYNGTSTYPSTCPSGNPPGQFTAGHYYRITRGTWSTDCGWQQISKVVFMCNTCRGGSDVVVVNDDNAPSYENLYKEQIAAANAAIDFTILPNPANGNFNIQLDKAVKNGMVEIYNLTGEKVDERIIDNTAFIQVNDAGLSKGIYLVRITSGELTVSKKLVVE